MSENSPIGAEAEAADSTVAVLVAVTDREGRILRFNQACEQLTGTSESEVRGRRLRDVMIDASAAEIGPVFEAPADGGERGRQCLRWRGKDGRTGLIEWSSLEVADSIVITGLDVGEVRATAETLRQREAVLRSIIETVVDGVITIDETGIVRSFSPAAERLFGFATDEVVGRSVNLLMPEAEQATHDAHLTRYARTEEKRIIGIGRELTARRKDGTTFPIDLAVSEFSVDDRRMFTGIVRDISDRRLTLTASRESEERLRDLAESASDWFWETDPNGVVTFVSKRFEAVFGVPVTEEIGKPRLAAARADDADFWKLHRGDIEGRRDIRDYRYTRTDSDGRLHHVRVSGRPRFDENGDFLGYRGVGSDVTENVEAELAAQRNAEELQQVQKMEAIGQLTGGIAHDFNNLLTVIFGNLELLEIELEDEQQRYLLAEVQEAAELGADLTARLLAFARRQPLEPKLLDLNDLVDGMGDLLARS